MACPPCLVELMRDRAVVEIRNPQIPETAWYGRIVGLADWPGMLIERLDGSMMVLPQAFTVAEVDDWSPVDAARSRVARLERELAEAHDLLRQAEQAPTEGKASDDTTPGTGGGESAAESRTGADDRDVGDVVSEAAPASEEGGAGEPTAGAPPYTFEGRSFRSLGDLFETALWAAQNGKAVEFFNAFAATRDRGVEQARVDLGYVIGYGDDDTRRVMYQAFDLTHPIFGGQP